MKRTLLFIIIIFIPNFIIGQKTLFDSLKVDNSTKIVGRNPHYDKDKTYEKYNFIIEDSIKIVDFIKNIKLGDEVRNSLENRNFKLTIVKNKKEIGSWTINPTQKSAMTHDGKTYKFDLNQITSFNQTSPLKHYHEVKVFSSKKDYENYLIEQKKNPNFLFDYSPQFKYEGSFEIEFKKSSKFSSPKVISEYLTPYIEKIVKKDEYSLSYVLNDKNRNNTDQFTMTIRGSKNIFEELKIKSLKNENWEETVEDGYFFYKQ
ncbi:hypothetical protein L1S34_10255 [Flavobacterium sp. K77]|uniref:hypothetical protein n=1 Tax=Flavobacterium sp. K77 TaxID=2910676 RepID=UPI001F40ED5A|nr:hypothetical protein [Flavobacterium sp. K77]MCF6141668.1 hypothetical protein [Flavobacterium sp. K77]